MSRTPLHKNLYLWAFLIGIITLTAIRPLLRRIPDPPPVIGQVPAYTLVNRAGEPFGSEDLRGEVYIASFFFTRCRSICPLLMKNVGRLVEVYRERGIAGIRLVSITVDPEHDTPERLREYTVPLAADPSRWVFLTGDPEDVRRVAIDGFKVPVGEGVVDETGLFDIAHTGKVVLVDGEGGIRGYYDTDDLGLEEVFNRAQHVRGHSPSIP